MRDAEQVRMLVNAYNGVLRPDVDKRAATRAAAIHYVALHLVIAGMDRTKAFDAITLEIGDALGAASIGLDLKNAA
ncbi:MAG: hypothetical protein AB7O57_08355 [Hyphomicrobiaceae bacterium]